MLSLALVLAASVAEQMAPADQGLVQCQMPNEPSKMCYSISTVRRTGPSAYAFESRVLVDVAGPITASINNKVFVRGSEICQVMSPRDVDGARFESEGQPLSAVEAAEYRSRFRANLAPLAGHRVCTRIVPNHDGLQTVIGTIDGKRIPQADYLMKWIAPEDGWRVAP